jgi:hypothetical protein
MIANKVARTGDVPVAAGTISVSSDGLCTGVPLAIRNSPTTAARYVLH